MTKTHNRFARLCLVAITAVVTLVGTTLGVSAQTYPDRPVKVIVPYSAGSDTDLVARVAATKLGEILKQNFIIENRPGTAGILGVSEAVKSPPDGYTLLITATQQVITPSLFKKLPYDLKKDLTPLARLTYHALALAVPTSINVNSVKDLVAYLKAHADTANYGSTGVGTSIHLASALFANLAGLQISHVPYSNASQALVGLASAEVQYMFYGHDGLDPFVQSGKVKLLATSGDKRAPWAPDLPTVKESGYPDYTLYSWQGMAVPAHTPQPIIDILDKALAKGLADPETKKMFERAGTSSAYLGGEDYRRYFDSEIDRYRAIVKMAGVPQQ